MKTLLSFCAVWMLVITIVSGQVPSIDQIKTEPITSTSGISLKLHSAVLNEDRSIMIYVPDGYKTSTKKYPVLYMLDGQWNFNHTAQTVGWLSDKSMIPQTIVVGLDTKENRSRDLLPTMDKQSKSGGGADKLYRFIKEELIPFIDKNYRTYNYRVLGGVSFGGVFVMHAFVTDSQLFNNYMSLSPSMWWDNRVLLNRTEELLSKNPRLHNNLYIAMANEGINMGVDSLAAILKKYAPKELVWKYDKYPEEVHETVNYKGTWNGLKFVFADWSYPLVDFTTKENPFSSKDSVIYTPVKHTLKNLPDTVLNRYSGLYLDSYKRILAITKAEHTLIFSCTQLPTVTLYPEAENKFFLKDFDVQNKLFLKNIDIQFNFIKNDSVIITANGKIDCTAKKIMPLAIVQLPDNILESYVGSFLSPDKNNNFHVVKEDNKLKVLGNEKLLTYLYPVGKNRFYAFIDGAGYELEYIKDGSNKMIKINVTKDGKLLFEAPKINDK